MTMKWIGVLLALLLAGPAAATITSPQATVTDPGNGVATSFAYPFLIPYQSNGVTPAVTVGVMTNATGAITALSAGQYTITGVGNPTGGTVVYNPGTPISSSQSLVITRSLAYTQPTAVPNSSFYPHTVETVADSLEAQIQQLALGMPGATPTLPNAGLPNLSPSVESSGLPGLDNANWFIYQNWTTPPPTTNTATFRVDRHAAYVGGVNTNVYNAGLFNTYASAGEQNSEWTLLAFMDNSATQADGSQNSALYAKSIKESTGSTWAAVFQTDDTLANPVTGSVGVEVDLLTNGGDTNHGRAVMQLLGGPSVGTGATQFEALGIGTTSPTSTPDPTNTFIVGIDFTNSIFNNLIKAEASTHIFNGIDLSAATFTGGAAFKSPGFSVDSAGKTITNQLTAQNFIRPAVVTVAQLPAFDTAPQAGDMLTVSDATTCTANATPTGGGSTTCPLVYSGAAWKAMVTH